MKQQRYVDFLTFGKYQGECSDYGFLVNFNLNQQEAKKVTNSVHTLLNDLKACSMRRDLQWGKRIHLKALETRHDSNMYVLTALLRMYAKCGSMVDAHSLFDSIQNPDVVSWTTLLLGYAENGNGKVTLELFLKMKASGCMPDSVTYVAALKACTSLTGKGDESECLRRGREIHSLIGCHMNIFVQNTLIDMYAKCSSMIDAHFVFDSIQNPDVVSWNALLLGYIENGEELATFAMFSKMKASGCAPDSRTYVAVLKACTSLAGQQNSCGQDKCFKWGREIHSEIGCDLDIFVQSTLIDMYAKCGSMADARNVFDSIRKPDVVSWNALLLGYVENGDGATTLELFSEMKACRCTQDFLSYVAAFKACASLAREQDGARQGEYLKRGTKLHSEMRCDSSNSVQSTLIEMYAKCGSMVDARLVFDNIKKPDVVSWNALLMGYAENGEGLATLELLLKMKASRCVVDSLTYVAAIKACTSLVGKPDGDGRIECLKRGREIHVEIGCHMNVFVQSTLVDMYAKCGSMVEARSIFDSIHESDVVAWNALLMGYADNGDGLATLELFPKMEACGCKPNSVSYMATLKACGLTGALALGRRFHSNISVLNAQVVTCLVDFYAKCGSMVEAREMFDLNSTTRVVSTWNALLAGYSSFGNTSSVFNLFEAMLDQGFQPDAITFVCVLSCCSHAGLIEKAREYFEVMPTLYRVTPTLMHYTCMVDILGRANQLYEAINVLLKMPCSPDAVTWMTLLGACSKWKNVEIGRRAFEALVDMDKKNAPAYVLMAQIYGSKGMWEEQERVLGRRMKLGA